MSSTIYFTVNTPLLSVKLINGNVSIICASKPTGAKTWIKHVSRALLIGNINRMVTLATR